jgi:hypothetical protein
MVDSMRDMGGIVEQINPAKLTRPLRVNPASNGTPSKKRRKKK